MVEACNGEEGDFFQQKGEELATIISTMPKTYETDGQGDEAIAWLHYFTPNGDWYITERDVEEEQHQAFGLACLWEDESGYISIKELIEAGAELDLHFEPVSLREIKQKRAVEALMSDVNYVGHPIHY